MPVTPDEVTLDGEIALVTGAAVGIGRSVALSLAAFGAEVAICDRDEVNLASCADELEEFGVVPISGTLDVRDGDAVRSFVARVAGEHGHISVLVNNAGGGFPAPFAEVSDGGQTALVNENFTSVTSCIRAVLPHVPERGGSIVNITSIEAHRAGPAFAVYSAMKAAVASLTKSLALELGPRRIRVNCVAPDVIPTPGVGELGDPRTPLPRRGDVDDVAAAVVFLACDSLSGFVTGTTLHVDGGNLAAGGWHRQPDGTYVT